MGWQALKDIQDQNKKDQEREKSKKKTECGACGEPLVFNSKGVGVCKFCGEVQTE